MLQPRWEFLKNDAGLVIGPNNPMIVHHTGSRDVSISREVIQNSLDNRLDENIPVHVNFQTIHLSKDLIGVEELSEVFKRVIYELRLRDDVKQLREFQKGLDALQDKNTTIRCLKITDSKTKGAYFTPPDDDFRNESRWRALVKGEGASLKSYKDAGGSFGVGKGAPFATTPLRTVFYATAFIDEEGVMHRCYQGKAMLVGHRDEQGVFRRDLGFYGGARFERVYEKKNFRIPNEFRLTEPGLSLIIPCSDIDTKQEEIKKSIIIDVIENFFFAILQDRLEIQIEETVIKRDSLSGFNSLLREEGKSDVLNFIETARNGPVAECQIDGVGSVRLYLQYNNLSSADRRRREIALVRDAGMMISKEWTVFRNRDGLGFRPFDRRWNKFNAILECLSKGKDSFLRDAETPKHDNLSLKQIPDISERKKAKKAFNELKQWAYEEIKKRVAPDINELSVSEIESMREYLAIRDPESSMFPDAASRIYSPSISAPVQTFPRPSLTNPRPPPNPNPRPRPLPPEPIPKPTPRNKQVNTPRFRPCSLSNSHSITVCFSPEGERQCVREIRLWSLGEDGRRYPIGLVEAFKGSIRLQIADNSVQEIPMQIGERIIVDFRTREPINNKTFRLTYKDDLL